MNLKLIMTSIYNWENMICIFICSYKRNQKQCFNRIDTNKINQMFINRLKLWYSQMEKAFITTNKQCLQYLDKLEISYSLYEHQAAFNMDDFSKVKLQKSPYIKNLFYHDKKSGAYFLIIAENQTVVNKGFLKKLGKNMRMAEFEKVQQILKVQKGTVNPFSLVNDHEGQVTKTFIDEKLYQAVNWAFHPMDNTKTIQLPKQGVIKYLDHHKINYEKTNLEEEVQQKKVEEKKKQQTNLLGIQYKKTEDFANWYSDVIIKSGMLDYYDVSGCYILRPWAFGIWERQQKFFDALIKQRGVENAYFPMFVSKKALQTQKQHVEGFAPEVAWVTKSGKSDLAEPIAIRPTSETIMYPAYANWIKSHRDLPLKLNQWANIVRWEFKHPTPFIRTRQILWQQGHTAHATFEEAEEQTFANLQFYRRVYEQLLAVPVHKGVKTQSQRFAGGLKTTTVETWIPENGRAIQAATSHNLGQNFAKMFGIQFEDEKKEKKFVWQTSWGITTRSIGVLVMHHSDDKGLVLPPKVVNIQVVIIPIRIKGKEQIVEKASEHIYSAVKKAGIRVHLDDRTIYNPGWKFNHWQVKGVPIRVQIGPKDVDAQKVRCVLRYNGDQFELQWDELAQKLPELLEKIQQNMFQRAKQKMDSVTSKASNWGQFMSLLNQRKVILVPWCQDMQCEAKIKEKSGKQSKQSALEGDVTLTGQAKTLCVPLEHEPLKQGQKCFHCNELAKVRVFWGRSY